MILLRHRSRVCTRLKRSASSLSECFNDKYTARGGVTPVGLFAKPYLVSPAQFSRHAKQTIVEAGQMADSITTNQFSPSECIQRLDVLSDTLCKVVDLAAFVRISHPDPKMAQVAQSIHEDTFAFMNELNTNRDLYDRVCLALDTPGHELTLEERRVGEILKHDFEKSGIQFDASLRQTFINCANDVSVLGQHFVMNIGPAVPSLSFDLSELAGVNPVLIAQLPKFPFSSKVHIPLDTHIIAEQVIVTARSESVRQKVWSAIKSASDSQVELLQLVLENRYKMSQLAGYPSFKSYELADKLMKKPAAVDDFLKSLDKTVRPLAMAEVAKLGVNAPWNYAYMYHRHQKPSKRSRGTQYSLGTVFQGFSDLTSRLYGVKFEPGEPDIGELWDPEVRRLDVYHEAAHTKIGTVYCDLFSREGKQPNPAHFTIQCSRRYWPWESAATASTTSDRQLPVIALVCDFDRCGMISQYEMQTLFHELGHAVHSMLGQTQLHNVAGTRCATDFVELPSIVMEKFASSPRVLQELLGASPSASSPSSRETNWETHHQIFLSMLDQRLHKGPPPGDVCAEANRVEDALSLFPGVAGQHTRQFAQFGHLVSYGATYYSYLLDRCLANMTWELLFANDPLSREGGDRFKESVLKWGGAKDPQDCIESLLGRELDYAKVATYI